MKENKFFDLYEDTTPNNNGDLFGQGQFNNDDLFGLNKEETQYDNDLFDNQVVTPWEVSAEKAIDYDKLITKFGCKEMDAETIERFEK